MAQRGPHLIIISGIDGSGKSSHLAWITAALTARQESYRYVRLRWAALTSLPLLGLARLMGYAPRKFNARFNAMAIDHRYHESRMMRTVWPPLFVLDMALAAWRKVLRPLKRGESVICDRYVLDAVVDVAAMLKDPDLLSNWFARRLLALMPDSAKTLILNTDPRVAFERKKDVLESSLLIDQQQLYLRISELTGIPVVDGNRGFEQVQADIARIIGIQPLAQDVGVIPQVVD